MVFSLLFQDTLLLELNNELVCIVFISESCNEVKLLQQYRFVLGIRRIKSLRYAKIEI